MLVQHGHGTRTTQKRYALGGRRPGEKDGLRCARRTSGVSDELGGGGVGVMLGAVHGDHLALLSLPKVEKVIAALLARRVDAYGVIDKRQTVPRMLATLRAEHGMGANNVRG